LETVYSGAKGGVIAFTKTIAREVARSGVTANVVCPGPTRTAFLERIAGEGGEQLVEALTRAVPMRRLGEPEDVARPPWPSSPRTRPATSRPKLYPSAAA
jgi:2-hydroxycyclohexanecarboxyl-CoA dehydrogenase